MDIRAVIMDILTIIQIMPDPLITLTTLISPITDHLTHQTIILRMIRAHPLTIQAVQIAEALLTVAVGVRTERIDQGAFHVG